jgi:hypothetical protein
MLIVTKFVRLRESTSLRGAQRRGNLLDYSVIYEIAASLRSSQRRHGSESIDANNECTGSHADLFKM